jgi:hypothetical protein
VEDLMMNEHHPCCGCDSSGIKRRTFLAAVGGAALGGAALSGCATAGKGKPAVAAAAVHPPLPKPEITVQPVLSYRVHQRGKATSWRPWGAIATTQDAEEEVARIDRELHALTRQAAFPIKVLPIVKVTTTEEAAAVGKAAADVMLIYGATGEVSDMEALISADRHNLVFLRHKSGPVYLWYEITHPRLLRKTVDEFGQPGLTPQDVVVDDYDDVLWRLRALYALKNTLGFRIVAIGSPGGWGAGGQQAPKIAAEKWKMDIRDVSYNELGKRIQAARADTALVQQAEAEAEAYLKGPGVTLETDKGFVTRAFLLTAIFKAIMAEQGAQGITVNNCMSTIMPMSETTACLPLSLLNDSGALAFCESDFVVIPSGVLLHHIAGTPVFLNDPTYPHHGIVTLAHCTAPRRMDGKRLETARLLTHFESDYGAAPKVAMRIGQVITVIDPDFGCKRWIGFRGTVADNPFLDICRSQVDVTIDGDYAALAEQMCGFHWMLAYGDHLKEVGYALQKMGIGWWNLSAGASARA